MQWIALMGTGYWTVVVVTFLGVAIWESFAPNRPLSGPAGRRWGRHAILFAISCASAGALYRLGPVVVAAAVEERGWGLSSFTWLPWVVKCALAVILLDLVHYLVHRGFHSVSFMWRIHEVHHSDPDYDISTAVRFHPLEVLIGRVGYLAAIVLIGPPPAAVFLSELMTAGFNSFTHANASLPGWAERLLRRVFITPNLHRIHHSEEIVEQSGNFGQTLAWWDRLFGTYLGAPKAGEAGLRTGIKGLQTDASLGLRFMLAKPFEAPTQIDPAAVSARVHD